MCDICVCDISVGEKRRGGGRRRRLAVSKKNKNPILRIWGKEHTHETVAILAQAIILLLPWWAMD